MSTLAPPQNTSPAPGNAEDAPSPPHLWRTVLLSFTSGDSHLLARLVGVFPTALILLVQAVTTLRLHNVANSDEALYIDAGHAYFEQWAGGPSAPDYGSYFSGHPYAYPVVAAAVDRLGGLGATRFLSLLLMIGATFCVGAVARQLAAAQHSNHQDSVRWLAMLAFVLSGPVMFTGHLATYDAACVLGVAVAFRLALCGDGALSAAGAGVAIAVATVCKYTGGGFIPVVAALALLSTPSLRRNLVRTSALLGSAGAILLAVYLPSADFITAGIEFTTVSRQAHNYRSYDLLISELLRGIGIVAILALVGALVLQARARSARTLLICLVMAGAALAIPASQLRIHEYTSFDKHLAYSALFLAPLAGQVTRLPRPTARIAAISVGVYLLAVTALYRADFMFNEWPDSTKVVRTIQAEGGAGIYLGVGADSMGYYSRAYPNLAWEEPWVLFGAGHAAIRQAVETHHYAGIVVTSGTSASAELDGSIAYLTGLLKKDPDYRLAGSWPKHQYDENKFFLYLRR